MTGHPRLGKSAASGAQWPQASRTCPPPPHELAAARRRAGSRGVQAPPRASRVEACGELR
eukprot:CAMPEP_0175279136 /NCGR_PEP_ID=MMETSP0093-20121207/49888_1 /TAXON_ID=311494 /ORGANISM="Alexandrium monilatum, Strain CCMP3105" /LENGTH=59 /DNA_ID=CAMNT_0016574153 /DNA_START=11 /DNA_END=190 /DNA_ORIENTATION=+